MGQSWARFPGGGGWLPTKPENSGRQQEKARRYGGCSNTIESCVGERMMMAGLVAHAATRGAVKVFTQGLSEEMRRRDITAISAQSNEIVEAWHITGANLTVDGGTKG